MRKILFIAAAVLFLASTANAQAYGTAGCGLGSVVLGNSKGFAQVLAATLNGIVGNQTFGITSGTLNCGEAAASKLGAKNFIETNREALAKDIARGQGETVKNLATLGGCTDASAVGGMLQKNFPSIFPTASTPSGQGSDTIISTLRSEKALGCAKLGWVG